jgi:hypothetical protein
LRDAKGYLLICTMGKIFNLSQIHEVMIRNKNKECKISGAFRPPSTDVLLGLRNLISSDKRKKIALIYLLPILFFNCGMRRRRKMYTAS